MTRTHYPIAQVLAAALIEAGANAGDLIGARSPRRVYLRNQVACALRELTPCSLIEIGAFMDGTRHSTTWCRIKNGMANGGESFTARVRARLEKQ